jgi:hypothetical protein
MPTIHPAGIWVCGRAGENSSFLIPNSAIYAVDCQTPSLRIFATRRIKSRRFMPRR